MYKRSLGRKKTMFITVVKVADGTPKLKTVNVFKDILNQYGTDIDAS